ncbi:MAG: hypothetical protein AMJ95_05330 [Omnitrophica WOR_2 bacterium SM23_72]|nr:MAG: hypothetical protein AMJ95_05330 [Omnitrophica WOR_2 bacterium SM23_72]
MWYTDPVWLILSVFATFIFAAVCGIGILLTFFMDIYIKWDEKFNRWIIPSIILLKPLEKNLLWIDQWLKSKHKIIGPFLIILSLANLAIFFAIIDKIRLVQG